MNIFVLDKDQKMCAKYHCNKHVVKMIVESAQMLCAAHWYSLLRSQNKKIEDFKKVKLAKEHITKNCDLEKIPPYAFTHVRHPCVVWTSECIGNYEWHLKLMRCLLDEYTLRYHKTHKSETVWKWLSENKPTHTGNSNNITAQPQCMPDSCKIDGDVVSAYRLYYKNHKSKIAKWEPFAKTPEWF